MRKLFYLIILAIVLVSCEKATIYHKSGGNPNTTFDTKILNGYFVTSIAFDSKGNAWVGTFRQGLIKYNSGKTTVYNFFNSPIPADAVISDIAVDSKDNVWIGCEGLIKYDGNSFTVYNSKNTVIPEDFVHSVEIDSKDNVWFTSCRFREGGIVKYDGTSFKVFTPENSALPINLIQSIAIDHNDNVWLALTETISKTYLVKIAGNNWTTYSDEDLGFAPYYIGNIVINNQNEVCASIDYSLSSTFIHPGPQAFVFDGNNSVRLYPGEGTMIMKIKVDNEGNIWGNTLSGFAVYNWEEWIINNSIFKGTGSFTIEQAPDNKIWIGTGEGIYINN